MASSLNTSKSEISSAHFHDRKAIMKTFDVQAISLHVTQQQAFTFIADAKNLPDWAQAFASVDGKRRTTGDRPRFPMLISAQY
jgi:hypothetical protein